MLSCLLRRIRSVNLACSFAVMLVSLYLSTGTCQWIWSPREEPNPPREILAVNYTDD